MLTSLALVLLLGLAAGGLCRRLHLPTIIGMLFSGMLLGPYILDLLDPSILAASADLRKMALVIILLKAGLSLDLADLRRVGRPALLMACLPALCELTAYVLLAPMLLGIGRIEAAVMGSVLAAVSPAVVIPRMVRLMDEGRGTDQGIPQMIVAGASCDDVLVIVLFSTFVGMAQGGSARLAGLADIPVSILLGILLGAAVGFCMARFFEQSFKRGRMIRNSTKLVVVLGVSFLLVSVEDRLKGVVAVSGLLAVMSMACALRAGCPERVGKRLSEKFGKLWIAAEVILFVLVGAAVDLQYTLTAGLPAVAMILLALVLRAVGVLLCLVGTKLDRKERLYCVLAYIPKATVQAAIGSVPMALGLPCGKLVLSVAVLAILITAPLGAAAMDRTGEMLLKPGKPV